MSPDLVLLALNLVLYSSQSLHDDSCNLYPISKKDYLDKISH